MQTLTIGMATFRDTDGCYMTLQSLQAFHPGRPQVQYMVIDNAPEPDLDTMNVCCAIGGRYFHRPDLHGTSSPRDALFRLAKTDWVMCVDSHVILESGAVQSLLNYMAKHPESNDLIQGPMVHDDGRVVSTDWRPTHPPGLWGVWDTMWFDSFSGAVRLFPLEENKGYILHQNGNKTTIPDWNNRAHILKEWGYLSYYEYQPTHPFEIEMQGLGLFAMRRAAWPGFHPYFHGFGGEEGYIHEKVRRHGGKCYCLPGLRWRHKFRNLERNNGSKPAPYRLNKADHVWNLLVGHRELGVEATHLIKSNFGSSGVDPAVLDQLVSNAEKAQPFNKPLERKRLRLLGVWYTNNAAPLPLLQKSLQTVKRAADETMFHDVAVIPSSWLAIPDNPFARNCFVGKPPEGINGHAAIIWQIRQAVELWKQVGWIWDKDGSLLDDPDYDAIVFLEHDVLYPPNYFDRMGNALSHGGPVASNLDYEGLNATGWLKVKERHEPMHQLAMRKDIALANLERAERDCQKQGWALLEPDSVPTVKRDSAVGLLAVDFDGTLTLGWNPPSMDFIVITGRTENEKQEVIKLVGKRPVFYRPLTLPATPEGVARHKINIIRRMNVVEFWEDDRIQVEIIRRECPEVIVHHVSGPPPQPDRKDWARLGFVGLMPSIHVNW